METNVTIATIAKKVSEKNKPSAKRFIITCVVLILSVILLAVSVSMMLDTAWANDGEILTENVATTETMAEPAPAFDDEPIESVEESEPEAPVQAIEPVEEAANYIGTDEIRCYMSEFQYPEQRELVHRICKEFDVDEAIVLGICYHESRFQPYAKNVNTNGTTDWGMAQCNDTTFAELNGRIDINSMEELLDAETSIRACCALLQYYQELGLSGENLLLAYQQGYGGYKAVMAGEAEPWAAYEETKASIDIFDAYLTANT